MARRFVLSHRDVLVVCGLPAGAKIHARVVPRVPVNVVNILFWVSKQQPVQPNNEADVRHNTEKKIVAEHMLNVRLVRLQNRAVLVAAIFGAIGAAIGAYVTSLIQQPQKVERIYQHTATATPNDSAQNTGRIESKVSVYPKPIEPPNNAKANKDAENQKQP